MVQALRADRRRFRDRPASPGHPGPAGGSGTPCGRRWSAPPPLLVRPRHRRVVPVVTSTMAELLRNHRPALDSSSLTLPSCCTYRTSCWRGCGWRYSSVRYRSSRPQCVHRVRRRHPRAADPGSRADASAGPRSGCRCSSSARCPACDRPAVCPPPAAVRLAFAKLAVVSPIGAVILVSAGAGRRGQLGNFGMSGRPGQLFARGYFLVFVIGEMTNVMAWVSVADLAFPEYPESSPPKAM